MLFEFALEFDSHSDAASSLGHKAQINIVVVTFMMTVLLLRFMHEFEFLFHFVDVLDVQRVLYFVGGR